MERHKDHPTPLIPMNSVSSMVRGLELRLVGYTRALELCARMNRETEVLDFIDQIGAGEVLYDLGACEGRFALYAALRGVRCYAFEPEALNFGALMDNLALNGDDARRFLAPYNCAVGETTHAGTLKIAQPWAGGHQRVLAEADRIDLEFNFTSEQRVHVVRLDDFIAKHELPQPNYLKIDIDGSELPFIRGAAATLRGLELKAIMFELQSRDKSYDQIVNFLAGCGFSAFRRDEIEFGLFNVWFKRENGG
jgi:FkbM family methyltransferase